jgi:hypothetical protein
MAVAMKDDIRAVEPDPKRALDSNVQAAYQCRWTPFLFLSQQPHSNVAGVRSHAAEFYARLEDGSMPCDEPWLPDRLALFKRWIDEGIER